MHSCAPNSFAALNLESLISTPRMNLAPINLQAYITDSPTAPNPKTAIVESGTTLQLL